MALVTSGLIAQYKMNDSSGTTLTDSSGNANNGTAAVTIVKDNGGILSQTSQYITLPSGVYSAYKSALIYADFDPVEYKSNSQTIFTSGSTGGELRLDQGKDATAFKSNITNPGLVYNNTLQSMPNQAMPLMGMVAIQPGSPDVIYYNTGTVSYGSSTTDATGSTGVCSTSAGDSSAVFTGTTSAVLFGDSGGNRMYGRIYYALFYNRTLSAQEISDNYAFILSELSARSTTVQTKCQTPFNHLVLIGDSIGFGNGTTAGDYRDSFLNQMTLKGEWKRINLGVPSITIHQWQAMINTAQSAMTMNGMNVAIVELGINDFNIDGTLTTTAMHNRLSALCLSLRALGYYVIVTTMTSWPSEASCKAGYNTLIRNNYTTYANQLADLGADPNIGADGAYNNLTYFGFGNSHYNTAGHAIAAGIIAPCVDAIYSGPMLQVVNPDFELNYLGNAVSTQSPLPGWTLNGTAIGKFGYVNGWDMRYSGGGHQYLYLPAVGDYGEQSLNDTFSTGARYTITVRMLSLGTATAKAKVELFGSGAALATSQVTSGNAAQPFQFSTTLTYTAVSGVAGQTPKIRISCDTGSALNALMVKSVQVQKVTGTQSINTSKSYIH